MARLRGGRRGSRCGSRRRRGRLGGRSAPDRGPERDVGQRQPPVPQQDRLVVALAALVFAASDAMAAATLPEGGMGIHIAKTMLDEVIYEPGPPNLWRLIKRLDTAAKAATGSGRS